jgi:hypothetical protein
VVDNIISFPSKSQELVEEDPVILFIQDCLLPWAEENGLDINSTKFRLNGATIMTCLQGMLLDDI